MAKKHEKKQHSEEEGGEAWLLPYSDLMTLLLAVFIVLFAVSKVDQTKADEMAKAFSDSMITQGQAPFDGNGKSMVKIHPVDGTGQESEDTKGDNKQEQDSTKEENTISQEELQKFLGKSELKDLQEMETELDEMLVHEKMSNDVTTHIDPRGLVITLNNAILFDSGSAEIKTKNKDTLYKIAERINAMDNYIRVEGHTDNHPISTAIYPSNWELSTARAARVVRLFVDQCNVSPEKVLAVGYGEYKPIADNSTEKGREKNRRIDIIVLSEKYNNLEKKNTQK